MSDEIIVGLVAAAATLFGIYLKDLIEDKNKELDEKNRLNLDYLNPLRFILEETYFRMKEIYESSLYVYKVISEEDEEAQNRQTFKTASERCRVLFCTGNPEDLSNQSDAWFTGEGAYLLSSSHIVARLFLAIKKLKEDLPYVQLNMRKSGIRNRLASWIKLPFQRKRHFQDDDTILLNLVHEVSQAFLHDYGIYYVLQPSIGQKMYLSDQKRFITLEEFAHIVQIPEQRIWFDRMFEFFMEASGRRYFDTLSSDSDSTADFSKLKKKYETRLKCAAWAVNAVGLVSLFLDKAVGGGPSIQKRLISESDSFSLNLSGSPSRQKYQIGESHYLKNSSDIMTMAELNKVLDNYLRKQREELQKLSKVAKK